MRRRLWKLCNTFALTVNDVFISTFMIGLLLHDTLNETPAVEEAIRRMPEALQNERFFRMSRAIDLSCKKIILPEEEWTKFEEVSELILSIEN